jgi:Nif-specific regulatory protein
MTVGSRSGTSFVLSETDENRIGRGIDCAVVLSDPLCSRVHAILRREGERWLVRDCDSRNGTFVNDQKIDDAVLVDGNTLKLGSTEFLFRLTDDPPTIDSAIDTGVTQTILQNKPLLGGSVEAHGIAAITDTRQAQEMLLLYQLAMKLLSCSDSELAIRTSLDLLQSWLKATVAGYLWVTDDGHLRPKILVPENASAKVNLSRALTEVVCKQGNAVWINNQRTGVTSESLQHFADAVCVPLIFSGQTIGAIHVYLERGRFHQSDFDFTISLANVLAQALARTRREQALNLDYDRLATKSAAVKELIGDSPAMVDLKNKVQKLARATGCVLIRGESGAGKELIARGLHRASPRADRPMLCVNCAAIPTNLVESQLFGHKAGSFTGADKDHVGFFQQSDMGTLFLDEVGELPVEGQAKLLRILEGYPFLPVGGTKEINVDVRVIAATNQDLAAMTREKKFREDLYYRLGVFEIVAPPLRDRGADIELLLDYFFELFKKQHHRPELTLSPAARQRLVSYSWPGNVRQMRNVVDSAVILADGNEVQATDLGFRDLGAELDSLNVEHWEKRLITEALKRTRNNIPEAAELLGIGRATLYRKIDEFQLKGPKG